MDPGRVPPRELSPWSARRALTQQMSRATGGGTAPTLTQDADRPPAARDQSGTSPEAEARSPPRGRWDKGAPPRGRWDKGPPLQKSSEPKRQPPPPPERTREPMAKETSVEAMPKARARDASPEPYRQPREESRERKRDRSRDRRRERSKDRRRDRSKDRGRDVSRDRKRDYTRDKDRERRRDYSRDRDRNRDREKGKKRDRSRDKERDRRRDRSRDGRRHRSRSREQERDRRRDRSKDRRTRSPHSYRSKRRTRSPSRSTSPPRKRCKRTRSPSRSPAPRSKKPLPSQELSFRGTNNSELAPTKYGGAPATMEKPNFKPTGILAKAANKVEGTKISLKYNEPAEARKPPASQQWRIFVFKGDNVVDTIELYTRSCWLLGRSQQVVDYVLDHPSSSGQHAVIQFRYIQKTVEDEYGVKKQKGRVKPYIIDLESSNGTGLNGEQIETSRYFELRDKDILTFAGSEREYVVMLPPPDDN